MTMQKQISIWPKKQCFFISNQVSVTLNHYCWCNPIAGEQKLLLVWHFPSVLHETEPWSLPGFEQIITHTTQQFLNPGLRGTHCYVWQGTELKSGLWPMNGPNTFFEINL